MAAFSRAKPKNQNRWPVGELELGWRLGDWESLAGQQLQLEQLTNTGSQSDGAKSKSLAIAIMHSVHRAIEMEKMIRKCQFKKY